MSSHASPVDQDVVSAIVSSVMREQQAWSQRSVIDKPADLIPIGPIDLSTLPEGGLLPIPGPFTGIVMTDATDPSVRVNVVLGSKTKYLVDSAYPLDLNSPLIFKYPIAQAYLTWKLQPGKTATLFLASNVEIRPGKITLNQTGNVVVGEGAAFAAPSRLNVVALAASVQLFAQSTLRTVSSCRNIGANSVWVGQNGVTDATGWEIKPGEIFEWKNSSAIYVYSPGGSTLAILEETSS